MEKREGEDKRLIGTQSANLEFTKLDCGIFAEIMIAILI